MRMPLIAAALVAATVTTVPAVAQQYGANDAQNQREYQRARARWRQDMRDWRNYRNYDYNRLPPGEHAYYADQYYRDGRYYQPRQLTSDDRVYRGRNNRYYCRRSDGTTGLIIGAGAGALLGSAIAGGDSRLLGAVLGAAGGAAVGTSIDRGRITCR